MRVARNPQPKILAGDSLHKIARLLKSSDLGADVLCHTIALLGVALNVSDFRQVCVDKKIPKSLLDIVETRLGKDSLTSLEIELLKKATAVLLYFSNPDGPKACMESLLLGNAVSVLTGLCTDRTSSMFGMSPQSANILKTLTVGKNLIAETAPMRENILDEAYCLYVGEGHRHMSLKRSGYVVTLYDTNNPDQDININEEMLKSKTVSDHNSGVGTSTGDEGREDENAKSFQDVKVTSVINGGYVWAQVGIGNSVSATVEKVQQILEEWPKESRKHVMHIPQTSQFVCGQTKDIGHFRAQVLFKDDEDTVTLLAMDYGIFRRFLWQGLFFLTPQMNLRAYPLQAVLCRVKGWYTYFHAFGRCIVSLAWLVVYNHKLWHLSLFRFGACCKKQYGDL